VAFRLGHWVLEGERLPVFEDFDAVSFAAKDLDEDVVRIAAQSSAPFCGVQILA